jgi:hypothetical protein
MKSFGLWPQDDKEQPNGVILSVSEESLSFYLSPIHCMGIHELPILSCFLKKRSFTSFRMTRNVKMSFCSRAKNLLFYKHEILRTYVLRMTKKASLQKFLQHTHISFLTYLFFLLSILFLYFITFFFFSSG